MNCKTVIRLEKPNPKLQSVFDQFLQLFPREQDLIDYLDLIALGVKRLLYGDRLDCVPLKEQITFVLRSFDGIAHVIGDKQKELHLSLDFLQGQGVSLESMTGVIWHEMVHCWQSTNGISGGLVEGIADYVRLKAGYPASGWTTAVRDQEWDCGYCTTAYFLEWIETKSPCFVQRLNITLITEPWSYDLFKRLSGHEVDDLWWEYKQMRNGTTHRPPNRLEISQMLSQTEYLIRNMDTGHLIAPSNQELQVALHCDQPVFRIFPSHRGTPYYQIYHPKINMNLDVYAWGRDNHSKVVLYPVNEQENQQFIIFKRNWQDEWFYIRPSFNNKLLTEHDGRVAQHDLHPQQKQRWLLHTSVVLPPSGCLRHKSGQYLNTDGNTVRLGEKQEWSFIPAPRAPFYTIVRREKCLDIPQCAQYDVDCIVWEPNQQPNQIFCFTQNNDGVCIWTHCGKSLAVTLVLAGPSSDIVSVVCVIGAPKLSMSGQSITVFDIAFSFILDPKWLDRTIIPQSAPQPSQTLNP